MSAPLNIEAARAEWERAKNTELRYVFDRSIWAERWSSQLLDHIDFLHQAIRRAATDRDITHAGAYLNTLLDEVTR